MQSAQTLLAELVDYAGLFPPAKLDMATAVANYNAYVACEHNWMLGRLIVPLSRLDEFESESRTLLPTDENAMPWMISALLPPVGEGDLDAAFDRIDQFNESHSAPERGLALIDTVELKAATASMIDDAIDAIPEGVTPFFEIPTGADPRGMVAALSGTGARAKIRTGGVEPEMIPLTRDVLNFILACAGARVAFKATAGLHHPIRKVYPLTYESDAPRGLMHGYINVFLAATVVYTELANEADAAAILDEENADAFTFADDRVTWCDLTIDAERLALGREEFALSFGSCSFEEPVADATHLQLI